MSAAALLAAKPEADRRRDRHRAGRQPLPLRHATSASARRCTAPARRRRAAPDERAGAARLAQPARLRRRPRRRRRRAGARPAPRADGRARRASRRRRFAPDPRSCRSAADGIVTIVCSPLRDGPGHPHRRCRCVLADELGADFARVRDRPGRRPTRATATRTPTARTASATSSSRCGMAGATARSMLVAAAAARWGVPADAAASRTTHAVHDPATGKKARLRRAGRGRRRAAGARTQERRSCGRDAELRYIGRGRLPLVDGPAFVTGRRDYGADMRAARAC